MLNKLMLILAGKPKDITLNKFEVHVEADGMTPTGFRSYFKDSESAHDEALQLIIDVTGREPENARIIIWDR